MTQRIAYRRDDEDHGDELPPVTPPPGNEVSEATADLLDEIDSVLEANAEQFVAAFQQKGGQ